jgi:hypothetical protein
LITAAWRLRIARELLGVRHDVNEVVGIALDGEIETPAAVDPGLPDSSSLIIFLGSERWVTEISDQEGNLFVKSPLDTGWSLIITSAGSLRISEPH